MPLRIGIAGCGDICRAYVNTLRDFPSVLVTAIASRDLLRAKGRASELGIAKACTLEDLLADDEIDAVLNLTVPAAHAELALAAITAGKHVYNEKPLAVELSEAREILTAAAQRKVLVGCAPDTFLGAGLQTARKLLDDGAIGQPIGAAAFMLNHGMEHWHPNPEFFYQHGGGPLLDVGPYYVTALIALLGAVKGVSGAARISFPQRSITSQPLYGTTFNVTTPTHITGLLEFSNGAIATLMTSFDVWASDAPGLEIYGSEGTLSIPNPGSYGGTVRVWRQSVGAWENVPLLPLRTQESFGIGLVDLAAAIQEKRSPRASAVLAYHALEIMHSVLTSAETGQRISLLSSIERPAPL